MSEIAAIETGTGSKTQARCSHADEAGHCRRRTRYVYRAPTGLEVPVCAHHRPDTTDLPADPPDRLPLRLHLADTQPCDAYRTDGGLCHSATRYEYAWPTKTKTLCGNHRPRRWRRR